MKPRSIYMLILLVTATAKCFGQAVIAKPIPSNPISYTFKTKIENVPIALETNSKKYNTPKFQVSNIYYRNTLKPIRWWPEIAKNALAGEDNKHDIYMKVSVDSSDIYFNKKGISYQYQMECVAHLTVIDSSTIKVEIKVLTAKVHVRDELLPRPPHFVNNPVYKPVKPTTIEEYKVLQRLGRYLGTVDQMPTLKLH